MEAVSLPTHAFKYIGNADSAFYFLGDPPCLKFDTMQYRLEAACAHHAKCFYESQLGQQSRLYRQQIFRLYSRPRKE